MLGNEHFEAQKKYLLHKQNTDHICTLHIKCNHIADSMVYTGLSSLML